MAAPAPASPARPTNLLRSLTHVGLGLAVIAGFELLLTPTTARLLGGAWVVWAWSLEGARRLSPTINGWCKVVFGPVAREHEWDHVNSATWFGTGVFLLALFFPDHRGILGLAVVSVGDPVAGFVGRRWGRTRIANGRSAEGSAAFALSAFLAGGIALALFHRDIAPGPAVLLAGVAAITGAVVELVSTAIDDNLAIQVAAAGAVALAQALLLT